MLQDGNLWLVTTGFQFPKVHWLSWNLFEMLLRQHGEWNSTIFHRCSKSPTTLGAAVRSCSHILHSLCVCSLVGKTLEGLVASTFPETVFVSAPWIPGFYPNLANIYFQWRVVLDVSSWVFTPPSMCSEVEGPGLVTAFFLVKGRILGPDITCNFKKMLFIAFTYLFYVWWGKHATAGTWRSENDL